MADEPPQKEWHRIHLWEIQSIRDVVVIALILWVMWLGFVLSSVTIPLLVGLGLAYLFEPIIQKLGSLYRWATRPRMVAGSIVALVLLVLAIVGLTVPPLVSQGAALVRNADDYSERLLAVSQQEWVPENVREQSKELMQLLGGESLLQAVEAEAGELDAGAQPDTDAHPTAGASADSSTAEAVTPAADTRNTTNPPGAPAPVHAATPNTVVQTASTVPGSVWTKLFQGAMAMVSAVATVFGGIVSFGLFAFLTVFFFACFSLAYPQFMKFVDEYIPANRRDRVHDLLAQMDRAVSGFVRGRLLIAGLLALVFAIGWTICGVPYAVILGLVVGILSLIPYASGFGLLLAWVLLVVDIAGSQEAGFYRAEGGALIWWKIALFPAIVYAVAQILDDYVLTPWIQGQATKLGMAAIVVAVIVGGNLAGLYGMLLAIPVAACIRIMLSEVLQTRLKAWISKTQPTAGSGDAG